MSVVTKFNNTEKYIKLMQIEIGRNRTRKYKSGNVSAPIDSSGKLRQSLQVAFTKVRLNKAINSGQFSLAIKGNSYGEKIDEGGVVKANVKDIVDWIKRKPVKLKDARGRFTKVSDYKIQSIANNIARSISGNTGSGIKPTNFISDAIEIAMQRINSIAEPVEKDIHLNLDEIFKRAGYTKKGDEYIIE